MPGAGWPGCGVASCGRIGGLVAPNLWLGLKKAASAQVKAKPENGLTTFHICVRYKIDNLLSQQGSGGLSAQTAP
jgi:hypothetical protein